MTYSIKEHWDAQKDDKRTLLVYSNRWENLHMHRKLRRMKFHYQGEGVYTRTFEATSLGHLNGNLASAILEVDPASFLFAKYYPSESIYTIPVGVVITVEGIRGLPENRTNIERGV